MSQRGVPLLKNIKAGRPVILYHFTIPYLVSLPKVDYYLIIAINKIFPDDEYHTICNLL